MIDTHHGAGPGEALVKFEPHLHSVHSDGQDSVAAMFEACKAAGFDAVALTDHNTVSGLAEGERIARDLGLIFVPGVEVTTFHGHAVVLGVRYAPEWRDLEQRGIDTLAAEVHQRGGLLSVAHPASIGSPICSGCAWEWPFKPASIDLWEVVSAPRRQTEISLRLWRQLLEQGARVLPIAVGDVHSRTAAAADRVATYVRVSERTSEGVLDALRNGRGFLSARPGVEPWDHPGAEQQVVHAPDGRRRVYWELRGADGRLDGLTAATWTDTSQ